MHRVVACCLRSSSVSRRHARYIPCLSCKAASASSASHGDARRWQKQPKSTLASRKRDCHDFAEEVAVEADCGSVFVLAVLAGAGAGLAWWLPKYLQSISSPKQVAEHIEAKDFKLLHETRCSVTYCYCGEDPHWKGMSLRIRYDDCKAVAADRAACLLLAEACTPHSELLNVDAAAASALDMRLVGKGHPLLALREASCVPPEVHEGPAVTVQLRPGNGLGDLYGLPTKYSMQEDSSLLRERQARAGKYNAHDIFSDRPDRLRRALHALSQDPQDVLRIMIDGACVFPSQDTSPPLAEQLAPLGLDGMNRVFELLGAILEKEGKSLLMALLRAQCSANAVTLEQARQLIEVLQQHVALPIAGSFTSNEALAAAFARGFWNLPADDTGKTAREREGERLLERARRELWVEGSASRSELEAQVRTFLCRSLLGRAANAACVQLRFLKAKPDAAHVLRSLRFFPVTLAPGLELWCRLELVDFELPLEEALRA